MIKGLTSGYGIKVEGGNTSVPYVNQTTENPMQGMIRIWGSDMQVFSGSSWQTMVTSYASASLDPSVMEVIEWSRKAMQEDNELSKLAEKHPAVKAALENMRRAQTQLKTTIILSKDEQTTN